MLMINPRIPPIALWTAASLICGALVYFTPIALFHRNGKFVLLILVALWAAGIAGGIALSAKNKPRWLFLFLLQIPFIVFSGYTIFIQIFIYSNSTGYFIE